MTITLKFNSLLEISNVRSELGKELFSIANILLLFSNKLWRVSNSKKVPASMKVNKLLKTNVQLSLRDQPF